ncbi:MAG: FAD-dependent oxidoreductase [Oceanicoccus sp.]
MRIAVIGAGAAGLVTARELSRGGHDVTVFEQSKRVGGVWVFEPVPEDDPMGLNPSKAVFSSIYNSLRTNLPRDLMAFQDYTFDSAGGGGDDWQRYPHHTKVLNYLENFADTFGILDMIHFQRTVSRVEKLAGNWVVTSKNLQSGSVDEQHFDGVAVCNGHYSKPRVPAIAGAGTFSGKLMHSHNYRSPAEFANKRVVLLGTAASGVDIAREIATVSDQVYWCGNSFSEVSFDSSSGVHRYPAPQEFDGSAIHFRNAPALNDVDYFIYCTGYEYQFPFLETSLVKVEDNWVSPLYRDIVAPTDTTLAFIGLPFNVIPFPLFEYQAKWWTAVLSGNLSLPSEEVMMREVNAKAREQNDAGIEYHHRHKLAEKQFDYFDSLAADYGESPVAHWIKALALETLQSHTADPGKFRDADLVGHGPTVVRATEKVDSLVNT